MATNQADLQSELDNASEGGSVFADEPFSGTPEATVNVDRLVVTSRLDPLDTGKILFLSLSDTVSQLRLDGQGRFRVLGTDGANLIQGGSGGDLIEGRGGSDILQGNAGDDSLYGDVGNDSLIGGAGDDFLDRGYAGAPFPDTFPRDLPSVELAQQGPPPQLQGSEGTDTLEGGLGNDEYGVDNRSDLVVEKAGEGHDTIYTSLTSYTLGSHLEDLVFRNGDPTNPDADADPTVSVTGVGNELDNVIIGGIGSDYLIGGAGNDTLVGNFRRSTAPDRLEGGTGDDQYEIDLREDVIVENFGEGIDTIRLTIGERDNPLASDPTSSIEPGILLFASYSLSNPSNPGLANVENLTLVGRFDYNVEVDPYNSFTLEGNALDNEIVGAEGNDILRGLTGNDSLIGGIGNDTLTGGAGSDYYEVDNVNDVVDESDDVAVDPTTPGQRGGRDTIATFMDSYILPSNVENLTATRSFQVLSEEKTLSGVVITGIYAPDVARTFTGNSLDNEIVGGEKNDTVAGGAGNDFLIGGIGDDRLAGESGNDDFDIDSLGDVVVEKAGDGHDTISTSLTSYSLDGPAQGSDLVNVEDLIFKGAMTVVDPGNLDEVVSGQEASRPPTVIFDRNVAFSGRGNAQNNVMVSADGDDYLSGLAGNDTLVGLIGRDTLDGGDGRDELYGLSGADVLAGGADSDIIDGGEDNDALFGGLGSDKLWGNTGNDRIAGEGGNDQLVGDKGNDWLSGGTGNDRLFGEAGADTLDGGNSKDHLLGGDGKDDLRGGSGNDTLYGGKGSDILRGGAGMDNFVFNEKPTRSNIDRIVDFNAANDTIMIEDFYFANVGQRGRLTTDAFSTGKSAHDRSDRVIYDSASGALFYDADGAGGAAQFMFARLKPGLDLTNKDFVII
jgi:serralysin